MIVFDFIVFLALCSRRGVRARTYALCARAHAGERVAGWRPSAKNTTYDSYVCIRVRGIWVEFFRSSGWRLAPAWRGEVRTSELIGQELCIVNVQLVRWR